MTLRSARPNFSLRLGFVNEDEGTNYWSSRVRFYQTLALAQRFAEEGDFCEILPLTAAGAAALEEQRQRWQAEIDSAECPF